MVNPVDISSRGWGSEIIKFKLGGTKRTGYEVIAVGKTEVGVTRFWFSLEKCIDHREIKTSLMTRTEAIAKLKESKALLELDMMTQEEYDKLKSELAPIIKGEN